MSKLWYQQSASKWEEALPLGNGSLGAMVFGDVADERLQVNEESMWYGGRVDRNNPDARKNLPKIRELIFQGEIKKAEKLIKLAMSGCPGSMHPYQTLGDIYLQFEDVDGYTDYHRELDLEKAVYRQSFMCKETRYEREIFISKPAGIMVMHFTAKGNGKLNFTAALSRERFFDGVKKAGTRGICLYGNLGKGGFDFSMMLMADSRDGKIEVIGEHLLVSDASDVTLYFCGDTSYHVPSSMLEPSISEKIQKSVEKSLETLLSEHVEDYRSFYGRVDFSIGDLS